MPYFMFRWTEELEAYIGQHGVTRAEFEEVVLQPDRLDVSESSGLQIAFGLTSTGKYIACVYDEFDDWIYPTTAYEVD